MKILSRTIPQIVLACAVFMSAVGCGKPDNPSSASTEHPEKPGLYFKAELPDEEVLNHDPGSISWYVDSNIPDWTATSSESWCVATVSSKSLILTIEDYLEKNDKGYTMYLAPRVCTVEVKARDVYSKKIRIVQQTQIDIDFPILIYDPKVYSYFAEVPYGGGYTDIMVVHNAYRCDATSDADWLKLEFVDQTTLRITSAANPQPGAEPRIAKVTVACATDAFVKSSFNVRESKPSMGGEDFEYGDHTDWD